MGSRSWETDRWSRIRIFSGASGCRPTPHRTARAVKKIFQAMLLLLILSASAIQVPGLGAFQAEAQEPLVRRVNAPYFGQQDVRPEESAVFWFGQVNSRDNLANVRVGYNDNELYVRVAVFDRLLWYDTTPAAADLASWDSVSLYLDLDGTTRTALSEDAYWFVGQLTWWEEREAYQAAYRWDGAAWRLFSGAYSTSAGWRGNAPNDQINDKGWVLTYQIPFASLGLSSAPVEGTKWRMFLSVHDRDDASGTNISDTIWPPEGRTGDPSMWGELSFGLPIYQAPTISPSGTVVIRQGLNGAQVIDGAVGGGGTCAEGIDIWNALGDTNYAGATDFNIQNQADVADWPCYSRAYLTFPLDDIPPGKVILSAKLILHQYGNSGGGSWGDPEPSWIQVLTVSDAWQESNLTLNNAPLAAENFGGSWVDPLASFPGWPGVEREWDVSLPVAQAYQQGGPLRLALYSADMAYHSGKYFVSSDTEDWNAVGRPTLEVVWGEATPTGSFVDVPKDYWAYDYIETLYQSDYVAGCSANPPMYCPERTLSRAESSVFILRGAYGAIADPPHAPPSQPTFEDVDSGYWGYGWIESLWRDGYTAGCSDTPPLYCPSRQHTRAEGSVFFLRIKNGVDYQPPPASGLFADADPDAWYAGWVEAAYLEGLLPPCSEGPPMRFCPEDPLDRAWAAYMMIQAKNLPMQ